MTSAISKQELFATLVIMLLTTVTRRSIVDVAGVLDMPLKLVAIKSFKRNNHKIMSKPTKI